MTGEQENGAMLPGFESTDRAGAYVPATYREIASRWGMRSADQARIKVKRAGWAAMAKNHPSDLTTVLVPRAEWDAAQPVQPRARKEEPQEQKPPILDTLDRLRDHLIGEQEKQSQAGEEAAQVAALREQVARLEGAQASMRETLRLAEAAIMRAEQRTQEAKGQAAAADRRASEAEALVMAMTQRAQEEALRAAHETARLEAKGIELERRAAVAEQNAAERLAQVERLRNRGWLARLLGRE